VEVLMTDDLRKIREGALQPDRDPKAEPPGSKGSTPLNPITGRPVQSPSQQGGSPKETD
jgi:hypothetical protein